MEMCWDSANVSLASYLKFLKGEEQFKLVNTRDENLSDDINERQSMGSYSQEPKLNLVDQRENFAKINYLSDNDYDQLRSYNHPVTS